MPQRKDELLVYLKGNGEQFSSEMSRVMADAEKRAADTGARMRGAFEQSFGEVQALAKRALSLPRMEGGALNLDVASIKQAAAAAAEEAAALGQIAAAAERAALKTGDASEATRVYLQAARAAKIEAEGRATSLNAEAAALDRLQAEMAVTGTVQQGVTRTSNAQRAAMQQLSYQLGDVATQFASGTSPMIIFAQQSGQVIQALSLMTNGTKGFLGFLGGPWGIALSSAAVLLSPFIARLFDTRDAADETKKSMDRLSQSIRNIADLSPRIADNLAKQGELNTARKRLADLEGEAAKMNNFTIRLRDDAQTPMEKKIAEARAEVARLTQEVKTGSNFISLYSSRLQDAAAAVEKNKSAAEAAAQAKKQLRDRTAAAREESAAQKKALAQENEELQRQYEIAKRMADVRERLNVGDITKDIDPRVGQKAVEDAVDMWAKADQARQEQQRDQILDLANYYESLFSDGAGSIWKQFKREGTRAIAELAAAYTLALLSGQKPTLDGIVGGLAGGPGSVFSSQGGGLFGQAIGGVLSGVLTGKKGVSTAGGAGVLPGDQPGIPQVPSGAFDIGGFLSGGMLGGAAGSMFGGSGLGSMAGGALGQVAGKQLLGALGNFAGPVGSIVGGILGGLLGGAFKKTKKGVSTLGFVDDGELGVVSTRGNSSSRKQASISGANNVADALSQIAEQLGGELGGTISTSIGIRKKSYRVDTTGQGRLKGAGVLDFGQDEKGAIEAAIRDALSDGVITGISAASRKILASGKDLEKAIEMAVDIESIPKRLKAIQDPLGAAIDALNDKWGATIDALEAGGASAEQWADAQKLYQLELDQVKESTGSAAKSLKAFLDDLNFGSSSPLSLRDQEAAAKAALQPFLTQINSGAAVDQAAYQSAAQAFLDIERQIYGSTDAFFQQFDAIQAATSKAIATIENVQPIAESPFVKATAEATQQTANATQATAEILSQQTQQLSAILARLQQMGVSGMAGFIGSARGFT